MLLHVPVLLFALTMNPAWSQPTNCDAALIKDTEKFIHQLDLRLAILKTIREDTYSQMKADGSLGFVIPYLDIPIDASYQQFDEARRNYLNEYKFELNERESLDYYS